MWKEAVTTRDFQGGEGEQHLLPVRQDKPSKKREIDFEQTA